MSTRLIVIYLIVLFLLSIVVANGYLVPYYFGDGPGTKLLGLSIVCLIAFFGGRLAFMLLTTFFYLTLKGDESMKELVEGIWGIFIWDRVVDKNKRR